MPICRSNRDIQSENSGESYDNPHVKAPYERLFARGKSKMSAIGAAMRKLVHLCFGVIRSQNLITQTIQKLLDLKDGIYELLILDGASVSRLLA